MLCLRWKLPFGLPCKVGDDDDDDDDDLQSANYVLASAACLLHLVRQSSTEEQDEVSCVYGGRLPCGLSSLPQRSKMK